MVELARLLLPLAALSTVAAGLLYLYLHLTEARRPVPVAWRGIDPLWRTARFLFYLQGGACLVMAAVLMNAMLTHRFDLEYVFSTSSTDLPVLYLFASFWGGQEGTFLLWAVYGTLFGAALIPRGRDWEATLMALWCGLQLALLGLLLVRSPFSPIDIANFGAADRHAIQTLFHGLPPEGAGLNPLLQNPWMAIHPPILFCGFASMGVPFVYAMAGLVRGDIDGWGQRAMPWTLFGFGVLGTGLILGGYWAYETLGWGGYWAWDPVENSSLVPWLFAGALFHGIILQRQTKGAMRRFNLVVAALCFSSVTYGSYLNRSGVLADFSVHSFVALSPTFNRALLTFALLPPILFLWLYAAKSGRLEAEPVGGEAGSRKVLLHWITLLLAACGMVVLIGNSWPLISSLLAKTPGLQKLVPEAASLQPEFYNRVHTPVAMVMGVLLSMVMLTGWDSMRRERLFAGLRWPATIAMVAGIGGWVAMRLFFFNNADHPDWTRPSAQPYAWAWLTVIVLCTMAVAVNGSVLVEQWRRGERSMIGTHLAHTGFMILIIGIVVSSVYETTTILPLPHNQPQEFAGYELTYTGLEPFTRGGETAAEVRVVARRGIKAELLSAVLRSGRDGVIRNPAIGKKLGHDLYLEPGEIQAGQSANEIVLERTAPVTVDDLTFTFRSFDLGGEHLDPSNFRVGVELDVTADDQTTTLKPYFEVKDGAFRAEPVDLPGSGQVAVTGMPLKEEGSADRVILLEVTGRDLETVPETAVMQVTRKPFMSVVWLGCWLTIAGALMSAWRRRRG